MKKIIVWVLFSVFITVSAYAGPGRIVPYLSLKQEYSDNILFSASSEEEDFITTTTAGAVFSYNSERVGANLNTQAFRLSYWDNDQLDATDGYVSSSVNYKASERIGLGATAAYRKDSRRDTDADTTGLILNGDREKFDLGASSSWMFTETGQAELKFGYGQNETDATGVNEDNDSLSVNLAFSKNLSKVFNNTIGMLNFSYLHYNSEEETISSYTSYLDSESDVVQAYAGFSRNITELYTVYLQAGASYTDTSQKQRVNSVVRTDQDSSTWGGVLLSGVNYNGLYWDLGLSVSHDVRGSSGVNGVVERSRISFDLDRKVSDDLSFTFKASCFLNQSDRLNQADLDEFTVNIQPGFRYRIFDTLILSGIFRHTTEEDRESDTSSERNLVYLMLRKNFDLQ